MLRAVLWSATLAGLLVGAFVPAASGQAASVPLSLAVTASPAETAAGSDVSVLVELKNYKGDTLASSEPLTVMLHSDLGGDATLTLNAGQSSVRETVRFQRSGVATIVATAPKLASGSAIVVVKAAESGAAAAVGGRADAAAQPPPPVTAAAPPSARRGVGSRPTALAPAVGVKNKAGENVTLGVDVLPQHVHPMNAAWKALVLVTAINDTRQPVPVDVDTDVYLATDLGTVTPATARIEAGKARASGTIQLTSNRPGDGTLWAWTDSGILSAAAVEYHNPVPTQLVVRGLPSHAVNDGRTVVNVTVFLQDETSSTASAVEDTAVKLTSSVGTANPSDLSIPKGGFYGEAVLTSATSGVAEITATAVRLTPGTTQVQFVFPFLLVFLASVGGMVGSVVKSGRQLFPGAWVWHVLSSLGMGIVLGLVFFALAQFGIIASIPKVAIPLATLPTTNDLAALVLGFFGGFYGRSWLPDPSVA
jgi:hypothetical protein